MTTSLAIVAVLYSTMTRRASNTNRRAGFPAREQNRGFPACSIENRDTGPNTRGAGFPAREPKQPHEPSPLWHLAIDTGGTFTDCLAIDPLGSTHRAKVLSSGCLRATVCEVASPTRLCLEAPWLGNAVFPVGAILTDPATGTDATITDSSGAGVSPDTLPTAWLTLDAPLTNLTPGSSLELSTGEEAPILAARLVTNTPADRPLPPFQLRLATTRGTNALLERRGAPTAFFVTEGFADLLVIGDQTRPELFTLCVRKPRPLHDRVVEVRERLGVSGEVLTRLDLDALRAHGREVLESGITVAAVALMHAWRNPAHEQLVRDALLELGFCRVSISSELGATIGFLARAETAVVNAFLSPVIEEYLDRVQQPMGGGVGVRSGGWKAPAPEVGGGVPQEQGGGFSKQGGGLSSPRPNQEEPNQQGDGLSSPQTNLSTPPHHPSLLIMTSAGSLIDRANFAPKDSLLSGPAGGVVGAAEAGRRAGFERVITFDMGGTSTDCARCEGTPERLYQTRVGEARIVAPCVAVETVAAGGGSICAIVQGELRVGPESAGADPGPACYGKGGPLTITDCNLLLGRLDPAHFAIPLDQAAAHAQAEAMLARAHKHLDPTLTREALLAGFLDLANQRMAQAIGRITLRKGHDPAAHALVAFGGAGPQHACAIAETLGIEHVLVPPDAGLLSAFGLGVSAVERMAEEQILQPLDEVQHTIAERLEVLTRQACEALAGEPAATRASLELRYLGQDESMELAAHPLDTLAARFASRYRARFGYTPAETPLELVTLRVTATHHATQPGGEGSESRGEDFQSSGEGSENRGPNTRGVGFPARDQNRRAGFPARSPGPGKAPSLVGRESPPLDQSDSHHTRLYTDTWLAAPILDRAALVPGAPTRGPALLTEAHATTYLPPGWQAVLHSSGSLLLRRMSRAEAAPVPCRASCAAPIELELAIGKLTAIAEDMGERLQHAAISPNIKQRRDFSCAILDPTGSLLVNAPHIPVHLGSMGVCVRALCDHLGRDLRHATIVTNHPAFGGSHLPDVTIVQPVHDHDNTLLGYVAARAHHAEIGGIAPGSMAPEATRLEEEGVIIPPTILGCEGTIDEALARAIFVAGPYPSRTPATNRRDLLAAAHAVWAGAAGLRELARTLGRERFERLRETIQQRAETRLRAALAAIPDGTYHHQEPLLDGGPLAVRIEIAGDRAVIDFADSGPVHPRCLNATPAIVTSAVMYVLRVLVAEDLPLNEGLLRPVVLRIPEGLLDPPFADGAGGAGSPAVAGGNVEISQLLVETMLTALGLCAQGQGTMNNVVFGNASFGFYETLGGGSGGSPGCPGESAVHTHMTNTALTDPEILEHRFPVRLERSALRRCSGGDGAAPGGEGLERAYRFLTETRVGFLVGRAVAPRGLAGGCDGKPVSATLLLGRHMPKKLSTTTLQMAANTLLFVQTPGGGGFGETSAP